MTNPAHQSRDQDAAQCEAYRITGSDPADREIAKPLHLRAHWNDDSMQTTGHQQEGSAEKQSENGEYLANHGNDFTSKKVAKLPDARWLNSLRLRPARVLR